jgi:CHAD domain-containing protein
VARLVAHDPRVRLGDDPEDVHQARVATRRLRSDLRTFHSLLDEEWTQSLRRDLKSIGGDLGGVRDTEVLLDRLRAHAERLPTADQATARKLIQRLLQRWDTAEPSGARRSGARDTPSSSTACRCCTQPPRSSSGRR